MDVKEMIDFLGTDTVGFTFTPKGLKLLSLNADRGDRRLDLKRFDTEREPDPAAKLMVRETLRFLETGRHEMPLDFSGFTDFQQRVFRAVGRVEPGTVTTYKGIAEMLGNPRAAQAVGNAIGRNPVSYFLPTHRVLPQRGIGICRTGAGHLREKLLAHEGHDVAGLRGNYVCAGKWCGMH